jgi:hypothetical protein
MMHPTTASYIARSYASDRDLEASRERRLALAKQSSQPAASHVGIVARASRFVAVRLHRPIRAVAAAR